MPYDDHNNSNQSDADILPFVLVMTVNVLPWHFWPSSWELETSTWAATYLDEDHSMWSLFPGSGAAWSQRTGLESTSLETDVFVQRYALMPTSTPPAATWRCWYFLVTFSVQISCAVRQDKLIWVVFTVRLHVMQRTVLLSEFCQSVCPSTRTSVRQMRVLWQN